MSRNRKLILVLSLLLVSLMALPGCTGRTPPQDSDVKALLLRSDKLKSASKGGPIKVNSIKITNKGSKSIGGQDLYKMEFDAEILVPASDCPNSSKEDCDMDAVEMKTVSGEALFEWDDGVWTKAGLVLY